MIFVFVHKPQQTPLHKEVNIGLGSDHCSVAMHQTSSIFAKMDGNNYSTCHDLKFNQSLEEYVYAVFGPGHCFVGQPSIS